MYKISCIIKIELVFVYIIVTAAQLSQYVAYSIYITPDFHSGLDFLCLFNNILLTIFLPVFEYISLDVFFYTFFVLSWTERRHQEKGWRQKH